VNISLEKIDIQEGIAVKALFNSSVTGLIMSSEFTRKQKFKLKKIRKLIYKEHRERTEVNVIDK